MRNTPLLSKAMVNTVLFIGAAYTLAPLTWLLIASTKNTGDLFGTAGFSLGHFNLVENLRTLFTFDDGIFARWFANTVLYAGVGGLVGAFISTAAGYAFDKYAFRGKEKLFALVLLGVLVPGAVTAMPLYLLASKIGLTNTYWGVFLPGLASPFGVYLARMFSAAYVPNEMLEAARIDGAGELRIFFRVALPMLKPGFVTLFLFAFNAGWNSFVLPLLMLSDHHLYPLGLGLYTWNFLTAVDPLYNVLVITGSLISVIPLIITFVTLQRYWKAGLTAGALK